MNEINCLGVDYVLSHRRISFIRNLELSQNWSLRSSLFVFVHVIKKTTAVLVHGVDLVTELLYLLVHLMNCFAPIYLCIYGILNSLERFLFVMERNEFAAILFCHLFHPLFSGPQEAWDVVWDKLSLRNFKQSLGVCNTIGHLMVGIESLCFWLTSRRIYPVMMRFIFGLLSIPTKMAFVISSRSRSFRVRSHISASAIRGTWMFSAD